MNQTELLMQRKQTVAYIAANPVKLVLTRNNRVKSPTGGWIDQAVVLDEQTFAFIPASLQAETQSPSISGGIAINERDQLLAVWNASIQRGDTFTYNGEDYRVEEVAATLYRKIAVVNTGSDR